MPGLLGAVGIVVVFLLSGLKVLREYERAVVFRLGRLVGARGPGLVYVIPGIEKALRIDLRTITMDIPSQDVITKDNVSLKVNAVLYFRVIDSNRAVVEVENYLFATSQLAQTTLRSVCAEAQCQPAQRLADAPASMAREPIALQLRFLQTLVEVASENNSTTIFPVPIDILRPFLEVRGTRST